MVNSFERDKTFVGFGNKQNTAASDHNYCTYEKMILYNVK